ncbi:MAG TPA: hypothetical protein VNS79_08495 [Sphingobium sp.]|nr:hypothetical protein [Sphingobium sp.]
MSACRLTSLALVIAALAAAAPALAQPGWGRPGWGQSGWGSSIRGGSRLGSARNLDDSREGRVDAAHFVADDADGALGHGPIALVAPQEQGSNDISTGSERAYYEAAVIDQLVTAGYNTTTPDPDGGQVAEVRIIRETLVPPEGKRKPVSGEVMVGASNRGTMTGMAIGIDLSKPKKALVSTRLEARLRDRVTGKPLWEGHAEIVTRDGDSHWTDQAIATRLATALFTHFPDPMDERVRRP